MDDIELGDISALGSPSSPTTQKDVNEALKADLKVLDENTPPRDVLLSWEKALNALSVIYEYVKEKYKKWVDITLTITTVTTSAAAMVGTLQFQEKDPSDIYSYLTMGLTFAGAISSGIVKSLGWNTLHHDYTDFYKNVESLNSKVYEILYLTPSSQDEERVFIANNKDIFATLLAKRPYVSQRDIENAMKNHKKNHYTLSKAMESQ